MPDNLLPEGFKDEVSNQAATEHKYKNKIIDLFQSYGYESYKEKILLALVFSEEIISVIFTAAKIPSPVCK